MISFVICANSKWQDHASLFVNSLRLHETDIEIVLVDNGSPIPYRENPDYNLVRLEPSEQYNYMNALNTGGRRAQGDWLAFCNDDILCEGAFDTLIHGLAPRCLCGMEIREKDEQWGLSFRYMYGWIMLMHRSLWEFVGEFDEYYLHAGFDDLDYSWRAQQAGFELQKVDLPFVHLADQPGGTHRRVSVPGYRESMQRSKAHFLQKTRATKEALRE